MNDEFEMIQCYRCLHQNGYGFSIPFRRHGITYMHVHCDELGEIAIPMDEWQNCLDFVDAIVYTDIINHVEFSENDFQL
jgi:hypothetical protein